MPTYEYACTNSECGNRFDVVQSFSDPSITECPVCGQNVRKVYGAVGVVFKGSGFYRNDSREAAGRSGGASGDAKSDSPKSDSAKSDTATGASGSKGSNGSPGSSSGGGQSDRGASSSGSRSGGLPGSSSTVTKSA